jgi:16S rRNA (cytosine967-C5)-methyltransferase
MDSVDPEVLELMRLGAYQILYMGSVPTYAAVSETVEQIREVVAGPPAGFANAVLRKVAAAGDGPERFPAEDVDALGYLATWGSHPRWLVERWLRRWDLPEVKRLIEADNRRPSVCVVPLEADVDEGALKLAEAGIESTMVGKGTRCIELAGGASVVAALAELGPAIVQDPAANLVSVYADVPSGTMVADLCAAPGGKLLALPIRPDLILAADRSESRIRTVRENARRVGRQVALVVADARHPPLRETDVVLIDAPCTGTGTLARHPDARWRLTPESIVEMAALQGDMLAAAADVVRPGGTLVYSTCTLEDEENGGVVSTFLTARPDFRIDDSGVVPMKYRDDLGQLQVLPQQMGFDGSFAARMRRAG